MYANAPIVELAPGSSSRVARFFLVDYTNMGKCIPSDHKIYQMVIIYLYQNFPFPVLQNYTKFEIFGMQICISSGSPALKPLVNERKINFNFSEILGMMRRVARWFVLKTKIPIWVNFGGP
jgi:hypothetical protein